MEREQDNQRHFWHELSDGWRFTRRHPAFVIRAGAVMGVLSLAAIFLAAASLAAFLYVSRSVPSGDPRTLYFRTGLLMIAALCVRFPVYSAALMAQRWYCFRVLRKSPRMVEPNTDDNLSWSDRIVAFVCFLLAGSIAINYVDLEFFSFDDAPRSMQRTAKKLRALAELFPGWHRPAAAMVAFFSASALCIDAYVQIAKRFRRRVEVRKTCSPGDETTSMTPSDAG